MNKSTISTTLASRSLGSLLFSVGAPLTMQAISPDDLAARIGRSERMLIVDVRATSQYAQGHVPGAINIPLSLLPHKALPASAPVFVYTDGLGAYSDQKALELMRAKPGVTADLLDGGYAAWLARTRLATEPAGIAREKLPGITYQQLLAADKQDMVLVDLRPAVQASPQAASTPGVQKSTVRGERAMAADGAPDPLAGFAARLGVPLLGASTGSAAALASGGASAALASGGKPRTAATSATEAAAPKKTNAAEQATTDKLLVLVANTEAEANEAARALRASGHYRFTILIGGIEIIQHEGRTGLERAEGKLPAVRSQTR